MLSYALLALVFVFFVHAFSDSQTVRNKRILLHGDEDKATELQRQAALIADINQRLKQYESENLQLKQNLTEIHSRLQASEKKVSQLAQDSRYVETYIRWGRKDCPGNGSVLIYEGYAAGSWYNEKGGAAQSLCLTKQPMWGHYEDRFQRTTARIYGAEYEFKDNIGHGSLYFGRDLLDYEVPCAVCATTRPMVVMIPGRTACLDGWTMEYHGFLTGNYHVYEKAQDYICMDSYPTTVTNETHGNQDGLVFYLVEAVCGSLKCPPYINGEELTCVVCSK